MTLTITRPEDQTVKWDSQRIPRRLEILEEYVASHVRSGHQPLKGITALLIQHQLGSQVCMTEAMIRLGMDPRRIFWVNIPYSANEKVQAALRELGIPALNFSPSDYHLGKAYAPYQRHRLQRMYNRIGKTLSARDTLLVLDDGSYFLEVLACDVMPCFRLAIVEQTTRGIIKLKSDATLQHYCSQTVVVNVAESRPKKDLESPFVGEAVCRSLINLIERRTNLRPQDKCLILGFGDIGKNVAGSLSRRLGLKSESIFVGDPDLAKRKHAAGLGHAIWERNPADPVRFKLVVGCSGRSSFGIGDRIFLEDDACLASASSGSSELSREEFIDLADGFPHDKIYIKNRKSMEKGSFHKDITIRLVDREVRFLNGGFPVNFRGQVNSVPPEFIQTTHTLQVGGAVQAVTTRARGLVDLDAKLCDFVTEAFRRRMLPRREK